MASLTDEFFEIVEKEFQFLVDEFGFKKRAKRTDAGVYSLRYQTETTEIGIGFEWRDQYIYVSLVRLDRKAPQEKGRLPRPEDELTVFGLEDLLKLRTGKYAIGENRFGRALTRKDVKEILSTYARGLREHAEDVLLGDFSVFPKLEKIVRKRMKEDDVG